MPAKYSFVALDGPFAGSPNSSGFIAGGINNKGEIAGVCAGSPYQNFVYYGGFTRAASEADYYGYVQGINNNDVIVGFIYSVWGYFYSFIDFGGTFTRF